MCRSYTVLVADVSEERGEALCKLLAAYGISTDRADDADMAVRLAGAHKYDMLFMAEELLRANGMESAEELLPDGGDGNAPVLVAIVEEEGRGEMYPRNGFSDRVLVSYGEEDICAFLERWVPEPAKIYLEEDDVQVSAADMSVIRLFMSGVDVISGIEKSGGIGEYLDLLDIFYTDGLTRMDSLEEKIQSRDIQTYTIEVHGLKSAAANVGADALSALAKQHEDFGNASDVAAIEADKENLFACYQNVLSEMERVLRQEEHGPFAKREEMLPRLEGEEMTQKIRQVLGCLEDFRSKEAAKELEELLGHTLPNDVRPQLEAVQIMLKMYEDDDAEDSLRELLDRISG